MIGYKKTHSTIVERIATGFATAFLITPEIISDFIGAAILAVVFLKQMLRKRRIAAGRHTPSKQEVPHDR
jgi:TRAP-type uncharacterized transport system fused permease subunit